MKSVVFAAVAAISFSGAAQADSRLVMAVPPVSEMRVTCEYVQGQISPLQIFLPSNPPMNGRDFFFEFKNTQTGITTTRLAFVKQQGSAMMGGPQPHYFPGLAAGVYDVTVSRAGFANGQRVAATEHGQFVFKGLTIPNTYSTGGKGTGCRF